ncbi:hypothetical protein Ocin01_07249 [Orchesella cincta]|uniref:Uncharacterized protein n=1 Tax=Orchesella cincta TaxID=48709 RepID=A0A1D2N2A7_ORCCI|nr:hypothetical protein Ocin01_07249 [Orchesella cincta]
MWNVMDWVRILLVLSLALQLTASDSDFVFDDGLEPPAGRDDVSTFLNLSPWELYVLSELSLKLINTQCPSIGQDSITSLNDLLSQSFKQAQTPETQNEDFLPAYNHLVRCLDHVIEKEQDQIGVVKSSNVKDSEVKVTKQEDDDDAEVEVEFGDTESAEADWAAHDAVTTTTTEPPVYPDEESNQSFFSRAFHAVRNWFGRIFRSRRAIQDEQELEEAKKREVEIKEEQERRKVMIYRRARQNFANLFHSMSNIIRKTCPKAHRPEKIFLRKALLDMTAWATLDQTETISTAAKYFQRENLLAKVQECQATM